MNNNEDVTLVTVASYTASAAEYIQKTNDLAFFPGLQDWLDKFIELLPGCQVLDVAFGSGRDLIYMLKHGLSVEGIELVDEFIDNMRRYVDVPLYKMDMRKLRFGDNVFHGIWCCSSFLHLQREDALPTLKGFSRILRPQGILYLSLKSGQGSEWIIDGNVSQARRLFTYYSVEEITSLLQEAGLEVLADGSQVSRRRTHVWLNLLSRKR